MTSEDCPKGKERDIEYRLRHGHIYSADIDYDEATDSQWNLLVEAADEIVSLRQACRAMAREIERMKANETATKEHRRNDNREMVIPNVVSDVL